MRDDVNALDNSSPNHLKWLDSLAATRVAVGALCGFESGGSAEESEDDLQPVGPELFRPGAIGVQSDMSDLHERATSLLMSAKLTSDYPNHYPPVCNRII
jgi:hypothetical protein